MIDPEADVFHLFPHACFQHEVFPVKGSLYAAGREVHAVIGPEGLVAGDKVQVLRAEGEQAAQGRLAPVRLVQVKDVVLLEEVVLREVGKQVEALTEVMARQHKDRRLTGGQKAAVVVFANAPKLGEVLVIGFVAGKEDVEELGSQVGSEGKDEDGALGIVHGKLPDERRIAGAVPLHGRRRELADVAHGGFLPKVQGNTRVQQLIEPGKFTLQREGIGGRLAYLHVTYIGLSIHASFTRSIFQDI